MAYSLKINSHCYLMQYPLTLIPDLEWEQVRKIIVEVEVLLTEGANCDISLSTREID